MVGPLEVGKWRVKLGLKIVEVGDQVGDRLTRLLLDTGHFHYKVCCADQRRELLLL